MNGQLLHPYLLCFHFPIQFDLPVVRSYFPSLSISDLILYFISFLLSVGSQIEFAGVDEKMYQTQMRLSPSHYRWLVVMSMLANTSVTLFFVFPLKFIFPFSSHLNKTTTYEAPICYRFDEKPPEPRLIVLQRSSKMGFGFVAGSERPVIVRFVTEGGPSVEKVSDRMCWRCNALNLIEWIRSWIICSWNQEIVS